MNKLPQSNQSCGSILLCSSVLISLSLFVLSSCSTSKNSFYFKTLPRDTVFANTAKVVADSKIKKNDLLGINFSSLNKEEDMTYNAPAMGASVGTASTGGSSSGYQVDATGNIQLHKLGNIHVEGMTRNELKNKLQTDIAPYLKDPIVTVKYLNHRITVLGEVAHPVIIQMPEEQMSLLEVLGNSGDVTNFARRDNILVIRESEKGRELKRINLEDRSLFSSDWYYLQPNDIVYVQPNDKKVNEENRNKRQQTISMILSGASIAFILLNRIFP